MEKLNNIFFTLMARGPDGITFPSFQTPKKVPFNVSHNMDATNIHAELFFCSCSYVMALKSKCKWVQETCILRLILIPITSDFDFGLTHFGRT